MKFTNQKQHPKPFYQPLFDLMVNDHGLHLLDSEMDEIMEMCKKLSGQTPSCSPVTQNPKEDEFYERCEAQIKDFAAIHPDHPESICDDCGYVNVTWVAPSELWNMVCRPEGEKNGGDPMLCPRCFILRAKAIGIIGTWKVGL